MVDSIGGGSSAARSAIESALKRHNDAVARATQVIDSSAAGSAAAGAPSTDFSSAIGDSIRSVDAQVRKADALVDGLVSGKVQDLHVVAAALKESELALKFSLEVRNKFVDAYREIMRMSV
ncbi:MAG: flagellar hook-basal body complex protein FliE [Planctomycetes bacterium]|nr:flagellar hook-basal body complex protein FliE [Planctomycetota bacterium]